MGTFDQAKKLYEMQKKAKIVQKELKETEIEVKSNDGLVTLVFTGEQKLTEISIDESLLELSLKKELETKLLRTFTEGMQRAQAIAADKTKDMMKDMNLNIPGL